MKIQKRQGYCLLLNVDGADYSKAVSYTHLDVYKRQVPKSALVIRIFVPKSSIKTLIKNQNHHFHLPCMIFPQLHTPVSYTHLDVYKRQNHGKLEWSGRNHYDILFHTNHVSCHSNTMVKICFQCVK